MVHSWRYLAYPLASGETLGEACPLRSQTGAAAATDNAMSSLGTSLASDARRAATPAASRLVMALLDRIDSGVLAFTTPDGVTRRFGSGETAAGIARTAELHLRDWTVCRNVIVGGDIAFAESYMDGRWETTELVALLTLMACNQRALEHAF